jgi:predicted transcriptional regulator of viral defense system
VVGIQAHHQALPDELAGGAVQGAAHVEDRVFAQAPLKVWLAIPNRATAPRIEHPAIRVVRMSDDALTDGLQRKRIDGVEVSIFNPARSIVDCFKFRNKIGLDVAIEALREGWRERRFTMDELWHHATRQRVANVMRPYIEAITACLPAAPVGNYTGR